MVTPSIVRPRHRRPRALLVAALSALALAAAVPTAAAAARPVIGIGEHSARVFGDPNWQALSARNVRLVIGWDALLRRKKRLEVDHYMRAARAADANILLSFSRSHLDSRAEHLPSTARFVRQFRAIRARYPWVREFVTWNEANHCSQPTCHRPERVAEFTDAMRRRCPRCTVVGADVLDTPNMAKWVQRFRRASRTRSHIWGLHNYIDANRFRSSGTRALLRATKGPVWFTETGGVVWRSNAANRIRFRQSVPHAAKATRWVFKLAALSRRVKRVYFYNWSPGATWDSGLVDARGRPRPAYDVIRGWLNR